MTEKRGEYKNCSICCKIYYVRNKRCQFSKYCSRTCWSKRNPPSQKTCLYCGQIYQTYERKTRKYCNVSCRNADYSSRFKGDKSHLWRGGKTEKNKLLRSSFLMKAWRTLVFEKDKYTCIVCGGKKDLNAHHIIPLCKDTSVAFNLENGVTLCRVCHQIEHGHNLNQKKKTKPSLTVTCENRDFNPVQN